jgi:integrase
MHRSVKPRAAKSKPSFFTNGELGRLWAALAAIDRPWALAVCQVAATTGLRIGELSALTWADVDFLRRELHVRRTYIQGIGLGSPKSGEARVVDLVPAAQTVLERWYGESGGGDGPVFTREDRSPLTPDYIADVLYAAMAAAGVDRVGEGGRARTFHSFRHSYARASLEAGAPLVWLQRQLGRAAISTTMIYAAWAREAEKEQASRLVDAFAL